MTNFNENITLTINGKNYPILNGEYALGFKLWVCPMINPIECIDRDTYNVARRTLGAMVKKANIVDQETAVAFFKDYVEFVKELTNNKVTATYKVDANGVEIILK